MRSTELANTAMRMAATSFHLFSAVTRSAETYWLALFRSLLFALRPYWICKASIPSISGSGVAPVTQPLSSMFHDLQPSAEWSVALAAGIITNWLIIKSVLPALPTTLPRQSLRTLPSSRRG